MVGLKAGDVLVVEEDTVNPGVVYNLQLMMKSWKDDLRLSANEPPPWEDGWQPVSRKGKIAKRISKWMHEQGHPKLSPSDVSWIGNEASNVMIPKDTRIEITDRFDWNPGDFGDEDSCFFGGRRKAWGILHALGGRAAKIYPPDKKPGRCLILDWEDKPYVFNFYGVPKDEGLGIFEAALGEKMTPVPFRVAGGRDYPIYINNSTAYTPGHLDRQNYIVDMTSDDILEIADTDITRCEYCYKVVATAPVYQSSSSRPTAYLCRECYALLEHSTEPRWANAMLVPVPSVTPKKKRKIEPAPTEDDIEAGNINTWVNDTPAYRIMDMPRARVYRLPVSDIDIGAALEAYITAHNLCHCDVCMVTYRSYINCLMDNNQYAYHAHAPTMVAIALSEMVIMRANQDSRGIPQL